MCGNVGHLFIHAKFRDPERLRTAYMLKKPKFWLILSVFFLALFARKPHLKIMQLFKILHEDAPEPKELVCQIWCS